MPDVMVGNNQRICKCGFEIIEGNIKEDDKHFDNPDSFVEELLDR